MTNRQWGKLLNKLGLILMVFGIPFILSATYLALAFDLIGWREPATTRTQTLIDGPKELKISCTDQRGVKHKLMCSVNAEIVGIWVIFEYVDGKPVAGLVSNFSMSSWKLNIGSNVNSDILIRFYPDGTNIPIEFNYTLDTDYMRDGIRNFPGPQV